MQNLAGAGAAAQKSRQPPPLTGEGETGRCGCWAFGGLVPLGTQGASGPSCVCLCGARDCRSQACGSRTHTRSAFQGPGAPQPPRGGAAPLSPCTGAPGWLQGGAPRPGIGATDSGSLDAVREPGGPRSGCPRGWLPCGLPPGRAHSHPLPGSPHGPCQVSATWLPVLIRTLVTLDQGHPSDSFS